jgi:hypothetical protein
MRNPYSKPLTHALGFRIDPTGLRRQPDALASAFMIASPITSQYRSSQPAPR